jgi:hypothetical protein
LLVAAKEIGVALQSAKPLEKRELPQLTELIPERILLLLRLNRHTMRLLTKILGKLATLDMSATQL